MEEWTDLFDLFFEGIEQDQIYTSQRMDGYFSAQYLDCVVSEEVSASNLSASDLRVHSAKYIYAIDNEQTVSTSHSGESGNAINHRSNTSV